LRFAKLPHDIEIKGYRYIRYHPLLPPPPLHNWARAFRTSRSII
jgi:hypothetical protein